MRRGLLIFQFNGGFVLRIFLLFLFGAGLSGCGGMPTASAPKPVVCTPQAANVNIYRGTPIPELAAAPQNGTLPTGQINTLSAEQAMALLQGTMPQGLPAPGPIDNNSVLGILVNETKTWSDVQTIKLDDSSQAQIVVTFISPQLIQAVFNSEIAKYGYTSSSQPALDTVAAREELIFFVTVITNTNNNLNTTPHIIKLPVQKMVIMNADDVDVPPLHDDHILALPINSSYEPVFGYLSYPIAMIHETACSWILDPNYNKRIIITVSDILVDDVSAGTYTWVINYSPLFKVGIPVTGQSSASIDTILVSTSLTPPAPIHDLLTPNGLPESTFWQMYAGFLWRQVLQGIY